MNNRDLELLSIYLDGQLNESDSNLLESRITSDHELNSVLADLRTARNILRKLPKRKVPRNFILTRKMVGLNPPLPRSYSFFQFTTAFTSVLLMLTFAANILAPQLSYVAAPAYGLGGGGYGDSSIMPQSVPDIAAPAATEAPAAEMLPLSTASADTAREVPTAEAQMGKQPGIELSAPQDQPEVKFAAQIPIGLQVSFLFIGLLSALMMFTLRQSAKRKWQ